MERARRVTTIPPTRSPAPIRTSPLVGMFTPATIATTPTTPADAARRPAADRRRRLLAEPAATDRLGLEGRVERRNGRPELQELVRFDVAIARGAQPGGAWRATSGSAGPSGRASLRAWRARVTGSRLGGLRLDPDLLLQAEQVRLLAEGRAPRLARSRRAVVRRAGTIRRQGRRRPRPGSAPRAGRPCGSTGRRGRPDRGRSAARTSRPADQQDRRQGRAEQADDGVELARPLE